MDCNIREPVSSLLNGRKIFYGEIIVVSIAFLLVNLASQHFQKTIVVNGGKGWDGVNYYASAEQISRGERPRAEALYVYRLGTPFLASLLFKTTLY